MTHMYTHGVYSGCGARQSPFLTSGNYERHFNMRTDSFLQQTRNTRASGRRRGCVGTRATGWVVWEVRGHRLYQALRVSWWLPELQSFSSGRIKIKATKNWRLVAKAGTVCVPAQTFPRLGTLPPHAACSPRGKLLAPSLCSTPAWPGHLPPVLVSLLFIK